MNRQNLRRVLVLVVCLRTTAAFAGGPLLIGGPLNFGHSGQPFTWNPAKMPIQYRVDPGPMAVNPSGQTVIDNATGLQRIANILSIWQNVPTAAVSFNNAGPLLPSGTYTGGDVSTVAQFNDVMASCKSGAQSPVIFDANASLMIGLGLPPEVIGFTSTCSVDRTNGFIQSAAIVMNGKFQDGVDSNTNFELTANEFDEAIAHEYGHLLGLGHSQINLDLLTQNIFPCDVDGLAGLPLMFPELVCQARKDAGLPVLSPDDVAWISALYPNAQTPNGYALISGVVYFSDGKSQLQGGNVIARLVDDPTTTADESRRTAVSCISGYLFTASPGQSFTGDNTNGFPDGSRDPQLIGYYQIPVKPGTYTVEIESVFSSFSSDSGIGPIDPIPLPGPAEFWHLNESPFDYPMQRDFITVHAGDHITSTDIILNGTRPRFDQYEDGGD